MDENKYVPGEKYYLLSASWFEKWSFFYKNITT